MDDTLALVCNLSYATDFLLCLNEARPSIQFTMEVATNYRLSNERPCLAIFSNAAEIVDNTMQSGVFLISFKVFGNGIEYCLEYVI